MKKNELEAKLKELLLGNMDILKNLVSQLHSWNGSFDNLEWYENDEYFFETFFNGRPMEAVRAAQYGEYNYCDEYVRFNGYGNLESGNEYKVEQSLNDEIDDIIDTCIDNCSHISIDEIDELIEEYEE